MTTEIRVWQSYSCNNSSSYYLVAKFNDAKVLKDVATELGGFFKAHAKEMDDAFEEEDDFPSGPTQTANAFAKKHGFTWKNSMYWGDEMLTGDEPEILTEGDALILYHSYCGGGLPDEIPKYIGIRGGEVPKEPKGHGLSVSVLARLPPAKGVKSPLKKELDEFFKLMISEGDDYVEEIVPWLKNAREQVSGKAAYFCDGKSIGFFVPTEPDHLESLKKWLTKKGAVEPSLRICAWDDHAKFRAIAAARCTECEGALEYLDPRVTKIETEQLSCAKCGGMFDLATFMAGGAKKKTPPKKAAVKVKAPAPVVAKKTTKKKKAAAKKPK